MKRSSNIVRWIFTVLFGLCALGNGFHYSTLLLILSALFLMPIAPVRNFIKNKLKIKSGLAIALAIILFFVGILSSPLADTPPDVSDNSSISSTVSDTDEGEEISSENSSISEIGTEKNDSSSNTTTSTDKEDSSDTETSNQGTGNSNSSEAPVSSKEETTSVGNGTATAVDLSKVPSYSGKPYVTINNNIPNFSASELTQKGYEKYSPLDSLGRTQVAIASVGKDTMPAPNEERGSISSIKPSGWIQAKYTNISGGWLYNRCHLIGWQLSAENANKGNLITGTKYLNINGMLPFENMVADYIKETGDHVAYRITPIYQGNNLLASGVQMEAYSIGDKGESICFNVYCYNVQPGVEINYATGSSTGPTEEATTSSSTTQTPAPTPEPEPEVSTEQTSQMVWIPTNGGTKYHSHSGCSNMKNPREVTRSKAESLGYEPCKKCW